ncbi:type II toxin-antitoxin system Phd/YefM family antitoxin [uncultured Psychrobacter sp.]|uniref:type II toxin-antitoxin system Phd/YefM family antitoxin n=1 Tax=uncultured Psychrobacter sp. TaxID=259303 RepID=UPI00345881E8
MTNLTPVETKSINIHEAKTHLSHIIEDVKLLGQPVIIAKAGVPQVKLVPLDTQVTKRKMGTLKNSISIPDNFDQAFDSEIAEMFNGSHL